jgi:hypothetical protein
MKYLIKGNIKDYVIQLYLWKDISIFIIFDVDNTKKIII